MGSTIGARRGDGDLQCPPACFRTYASKNSAYERGPEVATVMRIRLGFNVLPITLLTGAIGIALTGGMAACSQSDPTPLRDSATRLEGAPLPLNDAQRLANFLGTGAVSEEIRADVSRALDQLPPSAQLAVTAPPQQCPSARNQSRTADARVTGSRAATNQSDPNSCLRGR